MVNKESVLSFFREKTKKPLGFSDIVSAMKLTPPDARKLKRILRELAGSGNLVMTRRGLYGPSDNMDLATGYFEAHRDGYGFVILEKPGERDIFVPARWKMGAMNNDRVIVRIENRQRRDGKVVRILERATTRIIGKLDITRTASFVRPKSKAMPFDLYVSPADRGNAKHGDNVIVEIINFPTEKRPPSCRVIKIIEKPEDPRSEIEAIIEEFNLPQRFQKNVHEEAKALSSAELEKISPDRRDLRNLPTVTIDGERARDFDDAISIKLTEHGYKLWVHIADVGHYVDWGSPIDIEARKRATSVYLADRVIPMLPKELSEDLCSLMPRVDRMAFTVEMDFDRNGSRTKALFYPSLINSDERMTYTSVRKILVDLEEKEREKYAHLLREFELMNELCGAIRQVRLARGSLDFDLPEPEVLLDLQGNPENIIRSERNLAHMIIEEFMIAANEAVAEYLEALKMPSLYRIHEEPDSMKLEAIMKVVKPLVRLRKKTLTPADFSELLLEIKGTPAEEIVNYMVLRSLKQARYSTDNIGHFGLASKSYSHFTSPIRRYPDLVVHRILREVLAKKQLSENRLKELQSLLPDIAFHSSRMERLADDAEREVLEAMRVWLMKDKVGCEYEARVVNVTPHGFKVRLHDFYVDGFIHISWLTDDFYQYNERALTLNGTNTGRSFSIGKELRVRIDKVDMEEREIVFGLC